MLNDVFWMFAKEKKNPYAQKNCDAIFLKKEKEKEMETSLQIPFQDIYFQEAGWSL